MELRSLLRAGSIALIAVASSCSGGGAGGARSVLPPPASPNAPPSGGAKSVTVPFRIVVGTTTSSTRRAPRYVSASTQSVAIAVAPAGGAASAPVVVNCTNVCSGQIAAPVGADTFTAKLFDQTNAAGNVLSTGTLAQTIVVDQANTVSMTFNGVVASLSVALNPSSVTPGTPSTVTVNVAALDADGNAIVGSGTYVDANGNALTVTLTSSDPTNARLSASAFSAPPATTPTLSYDGATIGNVTVSAGASNGAAARATLTIGCAPAIYVANYSVATGTSTIVAFPMTANGDQAPSRTLQFSGSSATPTVLALDASADLYAIVRSPGWNVSVYAPCASGTPTATRSFTDANSAYQSALADGLGVGPTGSIAVSLADLLPPPGDTIDVFPANASGAVTPLQTITGAATGLDYPIGAALDAAGHAFAANGDGNTITAYAPGATGNVAPVQTVGADLTQTLDTPNGAAWSATGMLYVASAGATNANHPLSGLGGAGGVDSIIVYAPGANGYPVPAQVIGGPATLLNAPADVAVDSAGNVYVLNMGATSPVITVYAPGATGNVAPARTLAGSNVFDTSAYPTSIAVDAALNLYVPEGNSGVSIFGPTANGNATPAATLGGSNVGYVDRVRVGPAGAIYVTASVQPAVPILVFAPGSTGNATPSATIDLPAVELTDIELDTTGDLWVSEGTGQAVGYTKNPLTEPQVVEFAPGANGNATPTNALVVPNAEGAIAVGPAGIAVVNLLLPFEVDVYPTTASGNASPARTIRGLTSGPYVPQNVALDGAGNIYAASLGDGTIKVYAPGASGMATPLRVIKGLPAFFTASVDTAGNVYVVVPDGNASAILIYAAGANGSVPPTRTLTGAATGITSPLSVTAGP